MSTDLTAADYEAWKQKQQAGSSGAANVVLSADPVTTPDTAAADQALGRDYSKFTGNPAPSQSMAAQFRPVFQVAVDQAKAATILSSSPMLSDWLRTPENAAVAKDDLAGLAWWEAAPRAIAAAGQRGLERLPLDFNQFMAESMAQRGRDQDLSFGEILADQSHVTVSDGSKQLAASNLIPGYNLFMAGSRFAQAKLAQALGSNDAEKAAAYQQQVGIIANHIATVPMSAPAAAFRDAIYAPTGVNASGSPDERAPTDTWSQLVGFMHNVAANPGGFAAFLGETAVESAPMIAASAAVTFATRSPTAGAIFLGASSGAQERFGTPNDIYQAMGIDASTPEGAKRVINDPKLMAEAARRGELRALVVGTMDALSGGVAGKELVKNPMGEAVLQSVIQAALGASGEAGGQFASGQKFSLNDVIIEGLAEFVTTPLEVGGVGGRAFVEGQAKAKSAEARVSFFKALSENAVSSKLRERLPERFQQFVERATANGPVENLYVPADKFVEYFQSKGIDPAVIAATLKGVTADDLQTAIETKGDLQIPTASYAASIAGTAHDAFLMENMKFSPDDFTSAEATAFNAKARDVMDEAHALAEQMRQDADSLRSVESEIYDTMVERLRIAGRATDVATSEAMLYPAFYRTMAERSGMSISAFMEAYPLPRVVGHAPAGMQMRDVTGIDRSLVELRARDSKRASRGKNLLEWISDRGGFADPGGELKAMDAQIIRRGRGRKTLRLEHAPGLIGGMLAKVGGKRDASHDLDLMAHAAYEAGYLAGDPRVVEYHAAQKQGRESVDLIPAFLDAVRRSVAGRHEYADGPEGDVNAAADGLDTMEQYLSNLGVSLADSDEAIKAAIAADQHEGDGAIYAQVNVDQAKAIDMKVEMPADPLFAEAVANTKGAEVTSDGLVIDLVRFQKPEQEGDESVRTGVFYLPTGSANTRHYRGTTTAEGGYGGTVKVAGKTLLKRPLFVKGSTGGKAPEAAFAALKGKMALAKLDRDISSVINEQHIHKSDPGLWADEIVPRLLRENGADEGMAWHIIQNSKKGNQLRYALQENIIAHAVREAGFDAVVGYSKGKAGASISEVFDVREMDYPVAGDTGTVRLHEKFEGNTLFQSGALGPFDFSNPGGASATGAWGRNTWVGDTNISYSVRKDGMVEIGLLKTRDGKTGQGNARLAMTALIAQADAEGRTLALTAQPMNASVKKGRLVEFYKSLGFVSNTGRSADLSVSASMIRVPVPGQGLLFQADGSGFGTGGGLQGPRGAIRFPEAGIGRGETIIATFASANLSTVIHESGHYFLTVFQDMARRDPAGPFAADYAAIKDWWHSHADDVAKDASLYAGGVAITGDDVRLALDAETSGDVAKDRAINIGMQEQFARATEAYLMEGKAPSIELRSAFEKFRAWLISVYRRALGLNVTVSDEMRGVFDRMLATDDEIAKAKADAGVTAPLFATAEEMGLSDEDYAKFRKLYGQAQDEAAGRLLAEVMAPIRRAATDAYKAEKKAVAAEVEATLKSQPMFRAIQELRFGQDFAGNEVPAVKLSREAIERDYGAGYLPFLPGATKDGHGHKNAVFSDEGGVHPDVVAGMYGYATGSALLDAISKAPKLADAVSAEVERFMKERYNDPLTDGSIQLEALDAVHVDKRGAILAEELRALNDVAGYDRGLTAKEARETARRTLRTMRVKDAVRVDRFLTAERNAGEHAFKLGSAVTRTGLWMDAARRKVATTARAAVRNDSAAAALGVNAKTDRANESTARHNANVSDLIEAKRAQLLNHMLYAEARKVSAEVDRLVSKVGKLNTSDAKLSKVRNVDYVKAARAVAARFGLARAEKDFDLAVWIEQLRIDDAITADALTDAIATATQDAKAYRDLTVAELGAVGDAVESLMEVGKNARLLEIDGQAVERDLAISELRDVMDARTQMENAALKAKLSKVAKFKMKALSVLSSLRRMENWSREMDDGKAGVFTKYLVKPVMDAVGVYRSDKAARLTALLAIINPRKDDLLGRAIEAPELGYTFENKGELLHAILHTGNESNLEKLLLGRGWSPGLTGAVQKVTASGRPSVDRQGNPLMTRGRVDTAKWDAMVSRLISEGVITKADYDTAQEIWDLMDAIKRPAQSAHRKVYGFYFKEVEAATVVTPFGNYRGGYVPTVADQDASNDGQIRADQAALEAQQSSFMFPTTGSGFTKGRVQNYNTPLALNLMLLPAHMDKVLRFTHLNPVIRQTASLVNGRELRGAIDSLDPTILPNLIVPWLQRTAQQAMETQPTTPAGRALSDFSREMRKRVGIHTMFINLVNTAQQITGMSSAMVLVKPSLMGAALTRFSTGGAPAMRAEAMEASTFMRDRIGNAGREVMGRIQEAIVKPSITGGLTAFVNKHGYVLQQMAQNLVDVITWHAAYDQSIGKGMTPDEAVFEADSVIRRTMGDFSPENVSMFETGPAFMRLFTMFYSYFNGQANLVGGEMQTAMRTMGWQGKGRMFFVYLFGMAIPAIVGEMIVQGARGALGRDDDKDGWPDGLADLFFGSQARYVAGMVPVVGQLSTTMLNRFNNQFYDDRLSTSPVISSLEKAAGAPASVWNTATGHGTKRKAVGDALTALGLITGLPLGQLAKAAGYLTGVAEGSSHPHNPLDVAKGLASGRDGTEN